MSSLIDEVMGKKRHSILVLLTWQVRIGFKEVKIEVQRAVQIGGDGLPQNLIYLRGSLLF